nr:MAG TPA: hypothetical protein [Bacteriophage sp.]
MALLKTNYKDDILLDNSGKRKYTMITNDDGTVSFVDVTDYSQNGDAFGAADINATNTEVNEHFASVEKSLEALNTKIIPVTFLSIMNNTYAHLYQSGAHFAGQLLATNDTPKNRISVKATVITGIGNASSSDTYYFVPVASVAENPFGLMANQYTCVGTSLDRATSSSGTLSVVPGFALALYNGTDTLLYCSVGGGSTTYASTKYLIWIDYFIGI